MIFKNGPLVSQDDDNATKSLHKIAKLVSLSLPKGIIVVKCSLYNKHLCNCFFSKLGPTFSKFTGIYLKDFRGNLRHSV